MADPVIPEPEETQVVDPAPGEPGTPEVDYQKRYDDLRPQYDKTYQALQAERQWKDAVRTDPEAQRAFLAELGLEMEEAAVEEFGDDPLAQLREELRQEFRGELSQRDQQAQQAEQIAQGEKYIAASIAQINKTLDSPLDEEDEALVIAKALTSPAGEDGMPDVLGAYKTLTSRDEKAMQRWAQTKRTTHRVSPTGGAGEAVPDMAKHNSRVEHMMTRLQDAAS